MASFNTIEATAFGYRTAWQERRYLLYLAAIPFLIKLICHMTVVMLGWETQYMRQALVMLPSYFADGWMLAHLARMIFLDQRWPFRPGNDPEENRRQLADRAHGIMGGMLAFVVVEFLLAGFVDAIYQLGLVAVDTQASPSLPESMGMVICAAGLLWIFRYFWFYIPAAIRYPLPRFSMAMKGFSTSIYMLAVWMACVLPGVMVYRLLMASTLPSMTQDAKNNMGIEFFAGLTGAGIDTILALISTAAMAQAIRSMIDTYQKNH